MAKMYDSLAYGDVWIRIGVRGNNDRMGDSHFSHNGVPMICPHCYTETGPEVTSDAHNIVATLRDQFAMAALPALIGRIEPELVCKTAYKYADSMLAQRIVKPMCYPPLENA